MKKRILVVDDCPDLCDLVCSVLDRGGFETQVATDGAAALKLAASLPDAVLLDASLPKMSGENVVSELKRNPATARIPVLFMSGHDVSGMKIDADAFLQKPFSPVELLSHVVALT